MAQTKDQAHNWYLRNKERIRLRNEKRKLEIAAVKHAYYVKNLEKRKQQDRAYYLKNRDHKTAWQREYYKENASKVLQIGRAWRERNHERVKINSKAYRESHVEYRAIHNSKRRAQKSRSPIGSFTASDWKIMKEMYRFRCVYCLKRKPLTQDHVIPLSKGGHHDKSNIVPACRSCNSRKNTREAPMYQPVLFIE